MELPPDIASEIRRRIDHYRVHGPGALSSDGKALRVDGSIGYDCWMSPEGDVYMETYDIDTEDAPKVDRSRRAQLLVLALGARTLPQLESLLPSRPVGATDCPECKGAGRFHIGEHRLVCNRCCGLGWLEVVDSGTEVKGE
jgi:hypothetical protein